MHTPSRTTIFAISALPVMSEAPTFFKWSLKWLGLAGDLAFVVDAMTYLADHHIFLYIAIVVAVWLLLSDAKKQFDERYLSNEDAKNLLKSEIEKFKDSIVLKEEVQALCDQAVSEKYAHIDETYAQYMRYMFCTNTYDQLRDHITGLEEAFSNLRAAADNFPDDEMLSRTMWLKTTWEHVCDAVQSRINNAQKFAVSQFDYQGDLTDFPNYKKDETARAVGEDKIHIRVHLLQYRKLYDQVHNALPLLRAEATKYSSERNTIQRALEAKSKAAQKP